MHVRLPHLVALAVAASACGGNSSSTGRCPATPCQPGQTCQPDGTCATAVVTPDGGIAACTATDRKPIGDSALQPGTAATAGGPAFVLVNHEPHQVGDPMMFDVPPGVASLTIVEQAVSAPDTVTVGGTQLDNVAVPHTVTEPNGTVRFDAFKHGETYPPTGQDPTTYYSTLPAYFFSDSPATGTLTFPNTTQGLTDLANAGQLQPGTWSALVSDFAYECAAGLSGLGSCTGSKTSTYQVTVIAKPVAGTATPPGPIATGGTMNVVLYLVGSPDTNPFTTAQVGTNCLNDRDLKRAVTSLATLYSQVGLAVNVTCQDVDAAVRAAYSTVNIDQTGACSDLSQLFTYAPAGNTLNLFLVSHIQETPPSGGSKTDTVGVDGTIPGPSSIGGTVASGAVVSIANLRTGSGTLKCSTTPDYYDCGPDEVAYIMAHEGGHFLGLYHLTEQYGADFDTLAGTPACPCKSCSSTTSTCYDPTSGSAPSTSADPMFASSCLSSTTCGGGDNLMFWVVEAVSQGKLVGEQGRVMRANPLIQ